MANTVIYQKRGTEKVKVAETPDLSPYAIKTDVDAELAEKADADDVAVNTKSIANIQSLLNGALSVPQTDTDTAYAKTVPSKAQPYAAIESIAGKSVVWNQLVVDPTITYTSNNAVNFAANTQILQGHKYFISCKINGTSTTANVSVFGRLNGSNVSVFSSSEQAIVTNNTCNFVAAQDISHPEGTCWLYVYVSDATSITDIYLIDLTLLYGPGNEPSTVAEFQAQFPSIAPAYNAGQLKSAGVTGAVSRGFNIIDEDWELGVYNRDTGQPEPSAYSIRFKNVFSVEPNTTYYANNQYIRMLWYDINDAFITSAFGLGEKTSPSNAWYMRVYLSDSYGTTYNHDICINISNASLNGKYLPYRAPVTLPIPAAVQQLPGYGWSAGTAYNEIDWVAKKYIQRVAAVDMGTLTWVYRTEAQLTNPVFSSQSITNYKMSDNVSAICARYGYYGTTTGVVGASEYLQDKQFAFYFIANSTSQLVYVRDTAYSDAAAFKSAMSGIMLYYELATPVITDISSLLSDDNLIEVEPGGTISFPSSLGDDYRIPVPSQEEYTIDLAPDVPSSDGTYTLQCVVADGVPTYSWVSA